MQNHYTGIFHEERGMVAAILRSVPQPRIDEHLSQISPVCEKRGTCNVSSYLGSWGKLW
jgi:hypothetical protein